MRYVIGQATHTALRHIVGCASRVEGTFHGSCCWRLVAVAVGQLQLTHLDVAAFLCHLQCGGGYQPVGQCRQQHIQVIRLLLLLLATHGNNLCCLCLGCCCQWGEQWQLLLLLLVRHEYVGRQIGLLIGLNGRR